MIMVYGLRLNGRSRNNALRQTVKDSVINVMRVRMRPKSRVAKGDSIEKRRQA